MLLNYELFVTISVVLWIECGPFVARFFCVCIVLLWSVVLFLHFVHLSSHFLLGMIFCLHNSKSSNPKKLKQSSCYGLRELAHLRTQICIHVSCITISYDAVCMICIENSDFFKNLLWCLYIFISVPFFFAERTWSTSKLLTQQIVMRFSSRSHNMIVGHSWVSWFQLFSRFFERTLAFEFLDNRTGTCWEVGPAAVVVHELDIITVFLWDIFTWVCFPSEKKRCK